jgi:hypothetical protein
VQHTAQRTHSKRGATHHAGKLLRCAVDPIKLSKSGWVDRAQKSIQARCNTPRKEHIPSEVPHTTQGNCSDARWTQLNYLSLDGLTAHRMCSMRGGIINYYLSEISKPRKEHIPSAVQHTAQGNCSVARWTQLNYLSLDELTAHRSQSKRGATHRAKNTFQARCHTPRRETAQMRGGPN